VLTCAHTAWKSTSAPLFFCTSGKETVEDLKISPGQLAPFQEKRIKRRPTVSSAGCKVLVPNAGFLLASMSSYSRFRPIECSYSQSVSVLVPQDKIRGSAIVTPQRPDPKWAPTILGVFSNSHGEIRIALSWIKINQSNSVQENLPICWV